MAFTAADADAYFGNNTYDPYADSSLIGGWLRSMMGDTGTSKVDAMTKQQNEMSKFYGAQDELFTYDDWQNYQSLANAYNGSSNRLGSIFSDDAGEFGKGKSIGVIGDILGDMFDAGGKSAADYENSMSVIKDFGKQRDSVADNDTLIRTVADASRTYYGKDWNQLNDAQKSDIMGLVNNGNVEQVNGNRSNLWYDKVIGGYNASDGGYGDRAADMLLETALALGGGGLAGKAIKAGAKGIGRLGAKNAAKDAAKDAAAEGAEATTEAAAKDAAKSGFGKAMQKLKSGTGKAAKMTIPFGAAGAGMHIASQVFDE